MLTTDDQKKIKKIIKDEVSNKLSSLQEQVEGVRGSVIKIERDRKILIDIWEFIKDHTSRLKDHEERITNLESPPKVS